MSFSYLAMGQLPREPIAAFSDASLLDSAAAFGKIREILSGCHLAAAASHRAIRVQIYPPHRAADFAVSKDCHATRLHREILTVPLGYLELGDLAFSASESV